MQRQQQQQQQPYSKNYNINLRKTIIENLCSLVVQHGSDMQVNEFKRCVGQVWDSNTSSPGSSGGHSETVRRLLGAQRAALNISRPFLVAILELKGKAKTRLTTNQVVVACDRLYRVFKKLREIKALLSDITLMKSTKPLSIWEEKALIGSMYQSADSFFHQEIDFFVDAPPAPQPQQQQERPGVEDVGSSQQGSGPNVGTSQDVYSPVLVNSPFHDSFGHDFSSPLVDYVSPFEPESGESDSPNID